MSVIPSPELNPAFRITRISHSVLDVTDLQRSRDFYVGALGFVVSDEDEDTLYLRGLEEIGHHSLVLHRSPEVAAKRLGFRCFTEDDLDKTAAHFSDKGREIAWVDVPFQSRTLRTTDAAGTPLEFCVSMETRERKISAFDEYAGLAPMRIDHAQVFAPDIAEQCAFYSEMGFRVSEYIVPEAGSTELMAVFMQRKGNPHDIVFLRAPGPRLHHTAFTIAGAGRLLDIGDILVRRGFADAVEWGPNRHWGPGWAQTIYLVDPDGHRTEYFTNHYQMIDLEEEPIEWTLTELQATPGWGAEAPPSWRHTSTAFTGVTEVEPTFDELLGEQTPFDLI